MAIIKKVKDWLGIEGVKIALTVPETFKLSDQKVDGVYAISSQSDQYLETVTISLKEKYSRGRRKSKLIDEYVLGQMTIAINEPITKDQVVTKEFTIEFDQLTSGIEKWGSRNILYGGLVGVMKVIKNAKSSYTLLAEVSVKGNKLKPYDTVIIVAD